MLYFNKIGETKSKIKIRAILAMSQYGESLWCYVKYTNCFIPSKMTHAWDGLVGSFLPSFWVVQ